jgi:NTP pyrophosphatase (non-canonical NTP hydrolase)
MSEVPQEVVNDYNTPETEPVDMDMDSLQAYQEFVRSTKAYDAEYALVYPILGLTNEAGEVAGKLKKIMRDENGQLSQASFHALVAELGDVLWYVTAVADDLGITISDIFYENYKKLSSRKARGVIKGSGDNR